jgi:hypothetical protein
LRAGRIAALGANRTSGLRHSRPPLLHSWISD